MTSLHVQAELRYANDFQLRVDDTVPVNGVTSLFGRSGCGKTTLLRVIAGLERVQGASVRFGDRHWQGERKFVPLHKRRIGLVFQEHSLLPHLTAGQNLLYGYRRTPTASRRFHPDEVTAMLDIDDLLERRIDQLSGGQRQRFSLGRALLTSPQLLLLDEPLSALDTQSKREITPFLSRMAAESEVPIIMVTHAPDEVERLADRVAFMHDGRITSVEPIKQALARPDSPLFHDEGAACVLEGRLSPDGVDGMARFGNQRLAIFLQVENATSNVTDRLRIHASDVAIARHPVADVSILNQLPMRIERIEPFRRGRVLVMGQLDDGQSLTAEITEHSCEKLGLATGMQVHALIKSVALLE